MNTRQIICLAGLTVELIESILWWPLWGGLGWKDIKQRYRRTILGPFWLTLSMGAMIAAIGVLYAELWNTQLSRMLPYVSAGMIAWLFISTTINDGCMVFIQFETTLKQIRVPYMICVFRLLWRNLIVLGHNLLIQALVWTFFGPSVGWPILLLIPGVLLVMINAGWFVTLVGLLCTRYRDVTPMIGSITQIMMFITPIFWFPNQSGRFHSYVVDGNVAYHLIEIIRQPLLGEIPPAVSYLVAVMMAFVGWSGAALIFPRYRRFLPFWL